MKGTSGRVLSIIGAACVLLGVISFVRPLRSFDRDATYQVTTSLHGRTVSEKYQSGAELERGARIGAVTMVVIGSAFLFGTHGAWKKDERTSS